jgi:plastocyanin
MRVRTLLERARLPAAMLVAAALPGVAGTVAALTLPQYVVSQKGREFTPTEIAINRGDTVQIVNDDGDLRHHAYIDSDKFSFDSGDQEPGTRANITIPVRGTFDVLCAIHPKMRLVIQVK